MQKPRGVTLLPVITKIFTALLGNHIQEWAEVKGIIPNCQFGFRGTHGTIDAIFILIELSKWDLFVDSLISGRLSIW